jgi:hypothetical protein
MSLFGSMGARSSRSSSVSEGTGYNPNRQTGHRVHLHRTVMMRVGSEVLTMRLHAEARLKLSGFQSAD